MRKLNETELYSLRLSDQQKLEMRAAMEGRLFQDSGIIAPEHIKSELTLLKIKAKNSMHPLCDAISLYEDFNGRIRLFDLGVSSAGRTPIPAYIPFLPGNARNRQTEASEFGSGVSPAIFFNMHRIGKWSADETQYLGLNVVTDLAPALESAYVAYALTIDQKSEKVFSNSIVLETLTTIYTSLFTTAVVKSKWGFGPDFNKAAARFIIAKFFLLYVLKKIPSDTVDEYALKATKIKVSLPSLQNYESLSGISYSSLTEFLRTLGMAFYAEPINLASFERSWLSNYGQGLVLAIEYVPFLIHFLLAARQGAQLGGSTRLYVRIEDLNREGLVKFYNALVSEIR